MKTKSIAFIKFLAANVLPNILDRHPENSKYELRSINEQLLLSTLTHWFISIFRKQITFLTGIVQNLYSPTPTMNVEEFWKVFTVSKLKIVLTERNIYQMNISHFWKTIIDHSTLLPIYLLIYISIYFCCMYQYVFLLILYVRVPIYLFINVICTYTSFY